MPQSGTVHARRLIATAAAAVVLGGSGTALAHNIRGPRQVAPRGGRITWTKPGRPVRPDRADWERIQVAARLRRTALEPHHNARFRSFAAFLGLNELLSLHPLGPGRCATAVLYLYDNLLDLHDATPGENWNPLRRLVAKEPSIRACAPPEPTRIGP